MNRYEIDRILLGDNPLMGVDHLSQERARERGLANAEHIADLLEHVYGLGIKGFVVSTHPHLRDIISYLGSNTDLLSKINIYPILPYVQGYVIKATEKGLVGMLLDIFGSTNIQSKFSMMLKGGLGLLKKDLYELFKIFIDIEIGYLKDTRLKAIFLHDVFTDLALGIESKKIFETFIAYVEKNYNVRAGLITKNFPRLVNKLKEWDIEIPLIMTSFNKVGFQMNPSREECEASLRENDLDVIAMSTLAAGYLMPDEAYRYISTLSNIKSIVVGMSNKKHAYETVRTINEYMKW